MENDPQKLKYVVKIVKRELKLNTIVIRKYMH